MFDYTQLPTDYKRAIDSLAGNPDYNVDEVTVLLKTEISDLLDTSNPFSGIATSEVLSNLLSTTLRRRFSYYGIT